MCELSFRGKTRYFFLPTAIKVIGYYFVYSKLLIIILLTRQVFNGLLLITFRITNRELEFTIVLINWGFGV